VGKKCGGPIRTISYIQKKDLSAEVEVAARNFIVIDYYSKRKIIEKSTRKSYLTTPLYGLFCG
jgi:hypothetical protein